MPMGWTPGPETSRNFSVLSGNKPQTQALSRDRIRRARDDGWTSQRLGDVTKLYY